MISHAKETHRIDQMTQRRTLLCLRATGDGSEDIYMCVVFPPSQLGLSRENTCFVFGETFQYGTRSLDPICPATKSLHSTGVSGLATGREKKQSRFVDPIKSPHPSIATVCRNRVLRTVQKTDSVGSRVLTAWAGPFQHARTKRMKRREESMLPIPPSTIQHFHHKQRAIAIAPIRARCDGPTRPGSLVSKRPGLQQRVPAPAAPAASAADLAVPRR